MRYNPAPFLDSYLESFDRTRRFNFVKGTKGLPSMKDIERIEDEFINLFFPGHAGIKDRLSLKQAVSIHLDTVSNLLYNTILLALEYESDEEHTRENEIRTKDVVDKLCRALPEIRSLLKLDAEAGFNGDPAAKRLHEIIICYPAIRAILMHRIAHFLFLEGIPLIPRMMNEVVHSKTGIDIHPGATIGKSFFIDHGTGVVIGETTIIGDNVKIYQGVTLGALSFPKNACGAFLKDIKRHPTIENNVTIYANSTILGDVRIGENSTIASNAWIKASIPPNSRVLTAIPEIIVKEKLPRGTQS